MNVLIVGASGVVGIAVQKELANHGYRLRCLDLAPPRYEMSEVLEYLGYDSAPPQAEWMYKDILEADVAKAAIADIQACVYVALALPGRGDDAAQYAVNVAGPAKLLRAGQESGLRKFLYAGTVSVNIGRDKPVSELDPPRLTGSYVTSKWLAEELLRHYSRNLGLSAVCLRLGTVRPHFRPVTNWEGNEQILVDVRDVARAFQLAIEAKSISFDVLHVVSNSEPVLCSPARARLALGFEARYNGREHFLGLDFRQAEFLANHSR